MNNLKKTQTTGGSMKKRLKAYQFNNHKMDEAVYAKRRQVMDIIYELKNLGLKLPRVDVRIGKDEDCLVLGKARLNDNIIWVTDKAINQGEEYLRNLVHHELLHAIYGCQHDESCPIMSATQSVVVNKNKSIEIFKKYYTKYNK
jgi:hypothetical protein